MIILESGMKKRVPVLFFLLLVCAAFLPADMKPMISVLDFETGSGVSIAEAEVFPAVLEVELKKTGAFDLIEASRREQILEQQAASLSGCTDDECAIEIGKLLTADRIVLGKLSKAGGEYILLAKIVNVGDGRVINAETLRSAGIGGLLDLMPVLAGKLAGTGSSGGEGRIVYDSGPAGRSTPSNCCPCSATFR